VECVRFGKSNRRHSIKIACQKQPAYLDSQQDVSDPEQILDFHLDPVLSRTSLVSISVWSTSFQLLPVNEQSGTHC
jgi:hypothetical protein